MVILYPFPIGHVVTNILIVNFFLLNLPIPIQFDLLPPHLVQ